MHVFSQLYIKYLSTRFIASRLEYETNLSFFFLTVKQGR